MNIQPFNIILIDNKSCKASYSFDYNSTHALFKYTIHKETMTIEEFKYNFQTILNFFNNIINTHLKYIIEIDLTKMKYLNVCDLNSFFNLIVNTDITKVKSINKNILVHINIFIANKNIKTVLDNIFYFFGFTTPIYINP